MYPKNMIIRRLYRMRLRVFNSLFDEKVFFKLPVKLWKYITFLFVILRIILMNTLFAIFPMVFIYILLRIFVSKDMKMFELLINHYKDKDKYYNP